jgi:putative transposase
MNPSERNPAEPVYFVTAIVGGWKHLFANEACARTVFDSLDYLSRNGKLALYAYALLPSHLCLLCRPLRGDVRRLVEGFAEFTAARMAAALRRRGRGPLMHYLHAKSGEGNPGSPIWGELRIQEVLGREKIRSLLELIHQKPVSAEWRLADPRSEYPYSSACFYDLGRAPILAVIDIRGELDD